MIDKKQAIENLKDVQREFPRGFLAYGSALSAHRDGDIIDHDLDTDFGVFSEDFNFRSITNLVKKGFVIGHIFGMRYYGFEVSLTRGGVKTDVMVIYKSTIINKNASVGLSTFENKTFVKYWNCLWDNGGRNGLKDEIRHEYKEDVFSERKAIEIDGFSFSYFGIKYIEAVYGEEWMTPVKEWDWRTDHKCRKQDE